MMVDSNPDHWDQLLHVIGQGWPHYKEVAKPLIGQDKPQKTRNNTVLMCIALAFVLIQHKRKAHI